MEICNKAKNIYGNSFTYTLFTENQIYTNKTITYTLECFDENKQLLLIFENIKELLTNKQFNININNKQFNLDENTLIKNIIK